MVGASKHGIPSFFQLAKHVSLQRPVFQDFSKDHLHLPQKLRYSLCESFKLQRVSFQPLCSVLDREYFL